MWDLSCPNWEDRIRAGQSLLPKLPLYETESDLAVAFFDALHLPDVPGTPLLRDAAGDWFRDIVRAVFGSRNPSTNGREIREFLALVGKGNSKTSYSAGLMLTAMLMNQRPRAEMLFIGPTQAIADLAFSQASGMIDCDPQLQKRFKASEHHKVIRDLVNESKLRVKTFDLSILTGPKPNAVLLDELHLLGKMPHAAKVMRQIRGGLEKNTEGFLVIISTQSDDVPAGVFKDELATARAIRDGKFKGRMLPILYELPQDIAKDQAKWSDPVNWHMVMPNLGRSLQLESLVQDWESEKVKGDMATRVWASQHLNIEIGLGLRSNAWAGASYWLKQSDPKLTLDAILAQCEVVCIGIDGGGLDDLLSLSVVGRVTGDAEEGHVAKRKWLAWGKNWCHRKVFELRKSEAPQLEDFVKAGELVVVDEMTDAFAQLAAVAEVVNDSGLLHQVGLDPAGVGLIVDALAEVDIAGDEMVVAVTQGWKMTGAVKTTEVKLAAGQLTHPGQGVMTWAVGNAKVELRGNAIIITKQAAGTAKIDPLMALFDAVALMSLNPESKRSYLDTEDLLVL